MLNCHILFFDLYTLFAVCKQSLQINITIFCFCAEYLSQNMSMSIFKQGYRKMGPFKNWASHIFFLRKRGLIVYLAGAENEGYSRRTPVLCHI